MAGSVYRLPVGGFAVWFGVCLVVQSTVVVAHGQHEHLLRRQTLAKCRYDDDCMKNAYCWDQESCFCKDDYIVYKNRTHVECLRVAKAIGDSCETDVQCTVTFAPFSECRQNICECADGSHYAEGRCYESVDCVPGLGQVCQTHHNCYIKDSYCVTGFCACTLRHHPNPRKDGCIPSVELGDECSKDYECVAENSTCLEVCVCKVDHVLSADGKRCLKAASSVGERCHEDSQCQLFLDRTECRSDGRCGCVENFHQRGSVCSRDTPLNGQCRSHVECVTDTYRDSGTLEVMNVDCVDGICVCGKDYIVTEGLHDCIRYSDNGATSATSWRRIFQILPIVFLASISML